MFDVDLVVIKFYSFIWNSWRRNGADDAASNAPEGPKDYWATARYRAKPIIINIIIVIIPALAVLPAQTFTFDGKPVS